MNFKVIYLIWTVFLSQALGESFEVWSISYLINVPRVCYDALDNNRHLLLILISSGSDQRSFERRSALRKTLGTLKSVKDWDFRFVFLRGVVPDEIVLEQEEGDVVIGSFYEKSSLFGFRWMSEFCPQAHFVLQMDDGVFINLFDVHTMLEEATTKDDYIDRPIICQGVMRPLTIGHLLLDMTTPVPDRPSVEYCTGWAYLIRSDAVHAILEISKTFKDDLGASEEEWVTGHLRERAGLPPILNIGHYYSYPRELDEAIWREWVENAELTRAPWIFILVDYESKKVMTFDLEKSMVRLWTKTIGVYTHLNKIKYTMIVT